jgi:hypothetical protein
VRIIDKARKLKLNTLAKNSFFNLNGEDLIEEHVLTLIQ